MINIETKNEKENYQERKMKKKKKREEKREELNQGMVDLESCEREEFEKLEKEEGLLCNMFVFVELRNPNH